MLVWGIGECVSGSCSNGHWLWIISLEQLWKLGFFGTLLQCLGTLGVSEADVQW